MRTASYVKMLVAGVVCCVGGPALVYYVQPTEEELFKKYNPDLQKRVLEERPQREKELQAFADQMREYSKSSKPIWVVQAEEAERKKKIRLAEESKRVAGIKQVKSEMLQEQRGE